MFYLLADQNFFICSDSILRHSSSDLRKMGQRIFIFIIGGATRSEVAQCFYFVCPEFTCWILF